MNTRRREDDLMVEANRIVAALDGRWRGRAAMCRCPAHDDRTPSLSVSIGDTAVLFHCYAGCSTVDVLAKIGHLRRDPAFGRPSTGFRDKPDDLFNLARRLWDGARPITGTVGEVYLRRRGLCPLPGFARYLPSAVTYDGDRKIAYPALVLPIEADDGLTGIQRVFLDQAGGKAPLAAPKLSLGARRQDGAVRYGGLPRGTTLNLAEGFEDAVSAMTLRHLDHCWAVCGIERYGKIAIPKTICTIRIWSQHGMEAERAIDRAEKHLKASGRTIDVILPPAGGDWNDALMAEHAGGSSDA